MPDVAFKDLCIDVTGGGGRPEAVARFWAVALQQPIVDLGDGNAHLAPPDGGAKERTVWINEVPEWPSGKSRVHIDVRTDGGDPAELVAAGGVIVREPVGEDHWHVLVDPDGVALCVMGPHPSDPSGSTGPFELNVDAEDPVAIATWWAERTGGTVHQREGASFVWIEGAAGFPYAYWVFAAVPEPKAVKNRVHWDVELVDATLDELQSKGATLLRAKDGEIDWHVMADPEGNEFCVFE